MINCVVLTGRLVRDPELKATPAGVTVTSFRIAVDRDFVKAGEERQTDFIDIVAWRQSAEFVCRFFRKGSMIAVQGSLQSRSYEDKNGNKRTVFEVIADKVNFCGSRADTESTEQARGSSQEKEQYREDQEREPPINDDLPF